MDTPPDKSGRIITLSGDAETPRPSPEATAGAAKKYIRTFEGDMEMLKKGGTPDLRPLTPKAPAPEPAPRPVPPPRPEPPPPPPPPQPVSPPPPPPPPPQPTEPKPSPIETYSQDFSERMKTMHASTATVLAAEQDAGTMQEPEPERHSPWGAVATVAGVLLLLVGGAGAYVAYSQYMKKMQPVVVPASVSTPIFVDEQEKIVGTPPADVLLAIEQSLERPLAPNAVRLLYSDISTTTGNSVFSTLRFPAPDILLRNLHAPGSMAGIVNTTGDQTPFFILSVASYGDTFAGMLSWEARMPGDLTALFPSYQSSTPTATTSPSTPIFSVLFHDEVVSNHDVRIYRDTEGRSILLYGYWNQTTLVIARSPEAFTALLERLATSRTQ